MWTGFASVPKSINQKWLQDHSSTSDSLSFKPYCSSKWVYSGKRSYSVLLSSTPECCDWRNKSEFSTPSCRFYISVTFLTSLEWLMFCCGVSGRRHKPIVFACPECSVFWSLFCCHSCNNPCKWKMYCKWFICLYLYLNCIPKNLFLAINNGQWSFYIHYAALQSRQQEQQGPLGYVFHFHQFWWISQLLSELHHVSLDLN